MHNDNNILNGLIDIGFSERQAKVYLVLYKKPNANLADLQKLTGIRQDKLGEVLNNLIREGYCAEKKIGRKRFFNVIDPGTSIGSNLKKMEERLEKSYKLKNALEEIYHKTDEIKEPFEYIEVFHGNDNIHYHFCELVKNSKKEILSFMREPFAFHALEQKKEQEDIMADFLYRKGSIKTNLPLKMLVFDNNTLLIADAAPLNISNELRVVLIKQQTIINAFIELFKFFWQQSIDIKVWKAQTDNMQNKK
jgi:sugar-specific transcriptional regulator TrmB